MQLELRESLDPTLRLPLRLYVPLRPTILRSATNHFNVTSGTYTYKHLTTIMKAVVALVALVASANAAQLPLPLRTMKESLPKELSQIPEYRLVDGGSQTFAGLQGGRTSLPKGAYGGHSSSQLKNTSMNLIAEDGQRWLQHFVTYSGGDAGSPDITYELIRHDSFPDYKLRLRQPTICDPNVVQYSGYLDISEDKHLFFWYVLKSPSVVYAACSPILASQVLRESS